MGSKPAPFRTRPPAPDILPTTKWANRVLRPLNSIVLRLEKHWRSAPPDIRNSNTKNGQNSSSPRKRASVSESRGNKSGSGGAGLFGSESSQDDPTWIPGQETRKRVRHKYSSGNPRVRANNGRKSFPRSPELRRKSLPGEVTIATPLIIGRTKQFSALGVSDWNRHEPLQDPTGDIRGEDRFAPPKSKQSEPLGYKVNTFQDYDDLSYLAIVDGICGVFEAFLRATSNEKPTTTGARSLMSMALSKVSDYIGDEQKSYDDSDDKDEELDMADVIFTELEDFYGLPGGGWKPLKELVRAHGMRLICESVRRKWISPQTTRRLIISSLRLSSHDAAESLFAALLSVAPDIEAPKGLHNCLFSSDAAGERSVLSPYLDLVSAKDPGHLGFFLKEVRLLILRAVIPVEWMATESMKPFMNRAVQSISCGDENFSSSAEFLKTVVLVAAGIDISTYTSTIASLRTSKWTRLRYDSSRGYMSSPTMTQRLESHTTNTPTHLRTALNNTISSLITLLSGIHIARFGVGTDDLPLGASPARDMITSLSAAVQQDIELRRSDLRSEFPVLQSTRCSYILIGEYLCSGGDFGHSITQGTVPSSSSLLRNFDSFIQALSNRKDLLGELSTLVGQVVTCCGRAMGKEGFDELKGFTQMLTSTSTSSHYSLKLLLRKIAVESAMNFAESTQQPDHHEWATEIQTKVAAYNLSQDVPDDIECPTPSLSMSKTGFRWEDSIGEWVAKTPAAIARNLHLNNSKTAILNSQDSSSSPTQRIFSGRKTSFVVREDSSSVASSSPPPSSRKRKRDDSSPCTSNTTDSNKSHITFKCVRIVAQPTETSPSRQRRLPEKHTWRPYADNVNEHEIHHFLSSPSCSPERLPTPPPRSREGRGTISMAQGRVLRERRQNTHLSRSTIPPKRRRSSFEVVITNKKQAHWSSSDDDEDSVGHNDDDQECRSGSLDRGTRPALRRQPQRSPSEESYLPPEKRVTRQLRSRRRPPSFPRAKSVASNGWLAPCSSVEIPDSEGSDDELSFL